MVGAGTLRATDGTPLVLAVFGVAEVEDDAVMAERDMGAPLGSGKSGEALIGVVVGADADSVVARPAAGSVTDALGMFDVVTDATGVAELTDVSAAGDSSLRDGCLMRFDLDEEPAADTAGSSATRRSSPTVGTG